MLRALLIAALVLIPTSSNVPDEQEWLDRGAAVLAPFKQQLKAELMKGMKQGTANAIDACSVKAPEIAESVSTENVTVGRTSHKLRNPANAPRPWVKPLIDSYLEDPADLQPRVVRLDTGGVGYVEPILAKPLCLTCHGTSLSETTQKAIAERYPDDEAVGFHKDDLRGLFWIEFNDE